ncbi:MAG: ISAs1 family transposase [Proteobacteria bacterium]|nr:ISAs1 family transposase [Pseudomonadota bacterium]
MWSRSLGNAPSLSSGKTSTEVAHYIGSGPPPAAARVAALVRGHWGIENELHWVLDMAFHEDQARHRARNTAANFTTLRHCALSLAKQDATRQPGVANPPSEPGSTAATSSAAYRAVRSEPTALSPNPVHIAPSPPRQVPHPG